MPHNKPNTKHRNPPRLKGFSYQGYYRYFVTIRCYKFNNYFAHNQVTTEMIRILKATAQRENFYIWAYCFMPDHLHLLIQGKEPNADMKRFITLFKQKTAYWFKNKRSGGALAPSDNKRSGGALAPSDNKRSGGALAPSDNKRSGGALAPPIYREKKLWQPGYYEHVLRNDEATLAVAKYIFQNPARKGIVKDYIDYSYLGSFIQM